MSYQGDAAEQVVRLSLETGEIAVRLAGSGAKQVAILLYAILKDQQKTKGKIRLSNLLRSGKELKVFAVKDGDLKKFCEEAKKYGVLYCVLKDKDATDGITDIMVRAEDASKINRIFERFQLATVDMAQLKQEIKKSMEKEAPEEVPPEQAPQEQDMDALLEDMLSPPSPEKAPEVSLERNPDEARPEKSPQSGPISTPKETGGESSDTPKRSRPSVRQELADIRAEQKKAAESQPPQKSAEHKAPRKKKSTRQKAR